MLTILTWLWAQKNGRATYTAENVNIWAAMVRRHLTIPHRVACVTDIPQGIDKSIAIITPPPFTPIKLPTWTEERGKPQCLRRISMFRPDAADFFGKRFVSMDLDCVIASNMDDLFTHRDDFRMFRGTNARRPYNGSMLQMTAGCRPHVWSDLTPAKAQAASRLYLGSDQAWIAYALGPDEFTWGDEHGVYWNSDQSPPEDCRIMFYPGRVKPWTKRTPWIGEHYRIDGTGRALIVGYRRTHAAAVRAAVAKPGWDKVIAVGPVAKLLNFKPDAQAANVDEAYMLARRMGLDDITRVGV